MQQQRIERVTTADGAEIAVASVGSGRPIILVSGWIGHLVLSRQLPRERALLDELGAGCRLVRYDRSGTGMSPAGRPPSLAGELDQLTAVASAIGADSFDLIGTSMGAPVAAAWAAQHPGSVRRLVLYGGWVRGADLSPRSAQEHVLGLVADHWGLGSDVLTDIFAPDADAASRRQFARYQRASSPAATARALLELSYRLDVGPLLEQVRAPTLVVHREQDRAVPLTQAEELARLIPGAELTVLPGRSHLPSFGDTHGLVAAMRRFLGLPIPRRGARELTPRQQEVAALVSEGATNREIAARLGIEERSAEGHVERIRLRLGVRSRAQIASWYAAGRGGSEGGLR